MSEPSQTTPSKDRSRIRWFVRAAALAIAIVLLWPARDTNFAAMVPGLSPFVLLGTRMQTLNGLLAKPLALLIGGVVLVRPRWFCRWLCPLGLCTEGASRLGRRWGRRSVKSIPLGQWILWLTLGGALLGWPLLLWLDPLAIFASLFSLTSFHSVPSALLMALPALAILLVSLAWPGLWCGRLCPLGAMQDVLSRPMQRWRRRKDSSSNSDLPLARRAVLGAVVGAASASLLRPIAASATRPIRPPGARDESKFLAACVRCGNCIRVCPTQIIEPDLGGHGLASLLTPKLRFEKNYCVENCVRCTYVCPTGALTHLKHGGIKRFVQLGRPKVDMNLCLLSEDRECSECRRWCPYDAIRYVFSETEYCLIPQIDPKKCNGCGACEMACPVKPKKAIVVVPLD